MKAFVDKLRHTEYASEKIRFLLFVFLLFLILFLARYLLGMAYSRYEVRAKINSNIDKALYIFEDETIDFNLESTGIIPRDDPYIYKFSVSNFNSSKQSDVDISYNVKVRTTTNLPITIEMYRNELPSAVGARNIFNGAETKKDADNAWYRLYTSSSDYEFYYEDKTTDIYTMVITFPSVYSSNVTYANYIESIEVILESKQII